MAPSFKKAWSGLALRQAKALTEEARLALEARAELIAAHPPRRIPPAPSRKVQREEVGNLWVTVEIDYTRQTVTVTALGDRSRSFSSDASQTSSRA